MSVPSLPAHIAKIDDDFLSTWGEVRAEAIDQVLDATVLWLALREHNCLTPQVGGRFIERTVKYGTKSSQNIAKGSTLQQNTVKRETAALFNWSYVAIDINRSLIEDQVNSGPHKIKDYITTRLDGAREDLVQDMEENLFCWADAFDDQMNGLFDLVPVVDGDTAGLAGLPKTGAFSKGQADANAPELASATFGNLSRATYSWWRPKNQAGGTTPEVTLRDDMNTFFNTISANVTPPNFIICDQDLYEYYQEEAMDKLQVVRSAFNTTAADLGFESTTFRGKPMTWSGMLDATDKMFFLNLDYIELVYDPNYFFDMTEWFTTPSQLERVAYIVSAMQLIDSQPRRHGLLDYNSTTNV